MAICNRLNRKLRGKANAVEAQLKASLISKRYSAKTVVKLAALLVLKMKRKNRDCRNMQLLIIGAVILTGWLGLVMDWWLSFISLGLVANMLFSIY